MTTIWGTQSTPITDTHCPPTVCAAKCGWWCARLACADLPELMVSLWKSCRLAGKQALPKIQLCSNENLLYSTGNFTGALWGPSRVPELTRFSCVSFQPHGL